MSTRDMRLEKLYAFKTKDLASLRTYDIEGARPIKRTWELNHGNTEHGYSVLGKAHPGLPGASNDEGRDKYMRGEEYRPMRNPMHYADANILKEKRGFNLKSSYQDDELAVYKRGNLGMSVDVSNLRGGLRSYGQNEMNVRQSHQAPLQVANKEYADSLEQFQHEHQANKDPPSKEELDYKKNFNKFYSIDDAETKNYVYNSMNMDEMNQRNPVDDNEHRSKLEKSQKEHDAFINSAAEQNVLFKRDLTTFYDGNGETPENFVQGTIYPNRSSTPNENLRKRLERKEDSYKSNQSVLDKKVDIFHYNFLTHKPKLVYSIKEEKLDNIKKKERHFDKFANDAKFKDSVKAFFAVETEFKQPDYSKRKAVSQWNELESINRSYGGTRPFYF